MEAVAQESELYAPEFASLEEARRQEPAWLRELRGQAFARFGELGFPTPEAEAWKYTNANRIAKTPWRVAPLVEKSPALEGWKHSPGGWKRRSGLQLVFVNGRFSPSLSDSSSAPADVQVGSLAEALRTQPDLLKPYLARHADWQNSAFTAWNTAFFQDGVLIRLPRGCVVSEPIHLVFLSEEAEEFSVSHPRNLILAEAGSQATVIETYLGAGAGRYLTNSVTEIVVEDGAVLQHCKVQDESLAAFHVQTVQARQERASNFTSHNVALGGILARTDVNVLFAAEGSECTLNGLFVGGGTQHIDNHTTIDHAQPHCSSRELYKGILDGKSRGVFYGKIIVRPDAQKTDAMQTNRNLLLSREALVNSTPALEIRADDVKCRHGSTIGQLDPAALFYLRSRGLGEADARALLTYAFASDLTNRIPVPSIREEIESQLRFRLGRERAA